VQAFLRTFALFDFREDEVPQLEALSQVLRRAPALQSACARTEATLRGETRHFVERRAP